MYMYMYVHYSHSHIHEPSGQTCTLELHVVGPVLVGPSHTLDLQCTCKSLECYIVTTLEWQLHSQNCMHVYPVRLGLHLTSSLSATLPSTPPVVVGGSADLLETNWTRTRTVHVYMCM